VQLTDDELAALEGRNGEGRQLALKMLANLGELYDAARLVEVDSVQLRCPISEAGSEGWFELVKYFASRRLRSKVPAFADARAATRKKLQKQFQKLNDSDMNDANEKKFGRHKKLDEYYERLGIVSKRIYPDGTSVNELESNRHAAVADASTAVFLNSRFAIRTNVESPATALAASVIGKTTLSGMHLMENRLPDIQVRFNTELSEGDLTLVGLFVGGRNKTHIPYFKPGNGSVIFSDKELFELSTALAHSGNVPMFHIAQQTPEHRLYRSTAIKKKLRIAETDLDKLYRKWRPDSVPDIIAVGAPYADGNDLSAAAKLFRNGQVHKNTRLWIFTTRSVYRDARSDGLISRLEKAGVGIFTDCLLADGPLNILPACEIVCDSAKTLEAVSDMKGSEIKVKILPTTACFELAATGRMPE
jgi:predicted aconitase